MRHGAIELDSPIDTPMTESPALEDEVPLEGTYSVTGELSLKTSKPKGAYRYTTGFLDLEQNGRSGRFEVDGELKFKPIPGPRPPNLEAVYRVEGRAKLQLQAKQPDQPANKLPKYSIHGSLSLFPMVVDFPGSAAEPPRPGPFGKLKPWSNYSFPATEPLWTDPLAPNPYLSGKRKRASDDTVESTRQKKVGQVGRL